MHNIQDGIFYRNPEFLPAFDQIKTLYYNGFNIEYILLEIKRYAEKYALSPGEKEGIMEYLLMFLKRFLKNEGDIESLKKVEEILSSIKSYEDLEDFYAVEWE